MHLHLFKQNGRWWFVDSGLEPRMGFSMLQDGQAVVT